MKKIIILFGLITMNITMMAQIGVHLENGIEINHDSTRLSGQLLIGSIEGNNLVLDPNEIQTKVDSTPSGAFWLNYQAGDIVLIGPDSEGNVRIGDDTGNNKLTVHVKGTDGIGITGDGTGNARIRISNTAGSHFISDDINDSNHLKLTSASDIVKVGDVIVLNHKGNGDGGQITLKDGSGNDRVKIYSQPFPNPDQGGWISLYNDQNVRTIKINAHDGNSSGELELADAIGTKKIILESENPVSGDARVTTEEIKIGSHLVISKNDRIGIGTTNPLNTMHIKSTTGQANYSVDGTSGNIGISFRKEDNQQGHIFLNAADTTVDLKVQGANVFRASEGKLGIRGRLPTTNALEVAGNASKNIAGDWLANSDRRIKTDIQNIENSLTTLIQLRPVKFKYSDEWQRRNPDIKNQYYYNFIAQEYAEVFPESVQGSGDYLENDPDEILQIDTYNAQILNIAATQNLIHKTQRLEKENADLLGRIERLESIISRTSED